jgi:site-specific DNA-methyltransferase (adenine-specific)/adenine-specific DNA-methyltransferase
LPALHAQEVYGDAGADGWRNRLIQGDNLAVMAALRAEYAGKIALIYLDPPFFTGAEWRAQAISGEPNASLAAYSDDWGGEMGSYLQWLLDRLTLARELLSPTGSLYLHLSWHSAHYVKLLLDEIFGVERFQNEIAWCYREAINSKKRWNRKHDTLLFYSRGERFTFNPDSVRTPYKDSHIKKYRMQDEQGAYRLMGRGITGSPLRSHRDLPPEYETQFPELTYRHYLGQGTLPVDYWLIDIENQASHARTGYPTQKPEALLERLLLASTNPGDLVADLCCGSGTTLAVAQRLERRWIGCDLGPLAIHTCRKRLLAGSICPGFTIECSDVMAGPESAFKSVGGEPPARLETHDGTTIVRLSDAWAQQADMWAVEWLADPLDRMDECMDSSAPLRPDWWSARIRRRPQIATVSAPRPPGRADRCRVALMDSAGALTVTALQDKN